MELVLDMASLDATVNTGYSVEVPATSLLASPIYKTSHLLYNILQFSSNFILVDARSSDEFNYQTIRTAINIDWIGAADLQNKDPKMRLEMCTKKSSRFALRKHFNIILFDNGDYSQLPGNERELYPAWQLINTLKLEGKSKAPIYLLHEGFEKFKVKYSYLIKGHPHFTSCLFPTEIIEGKLYLGNIENAHNAEVYSKLNIKSVVNCTQDELFPNALMDADCKFRVAVDDDCNENISDYFEEVLNFLQNKEELGNKTLIHCRMGMSRSATVCILYIMKRNNLSLKEAYEDVKSKRQYINPNPGFMRQLGVYENILRNTTTIRFPIDQQITISTAYEWLIDGKWIPRNVVTSCKS